MGSLLASSPPGAPDRVAGQRPGPVGRFAAFARRHPVLSLAALVAVAELAGLIGVPFNARGTESWYDRLDKPWFTPPSGLFAPVWTVLYLTMAVSAWLVARAEPSVAQQRALLLWAAQLVLNAAWSPIFFGARSPGWALVDIVLLGAAVAATIVAFARVRRLAAVLLVPYAAWLALAIALNTAIVTSN